MELKLLWVGVAVGDLQDADTMLVTESEDAAFEHALSNCPDGDPLVARWLCAVEGGKATMLCVAGDVLPIGVVTPVPDR